MFRDTQTMLAYEAKRSPDLAKLISDISSLSEDDIRAARVKLPWIRQALLELKRSTEVQQLSVDLEPYIVDSKLPDPMGQTRRWNGDTGFMKIGRGHLEIRTGQLLWFDQDGVWFDTVFGKTFDPMLMARSVVVGEMSKLTYFDMVRIERNKTINAVPHTMVYDGTKPQQTSGNGLFTIFRPI